jgi:hypothetical protein
VAQLTHLFEAELANIDLTAGDAKMLD